MVESTRSSLSSWLTRFWYFLSTLFENNLMYTLGTFEDTHMRVASHQSKVRLINPSRVESTQELTNFKEFEMNRVSILLYELKVQTKWQLISTFELIAHQVDEFDELSHHCTKRVGRVDPSTHHGTELGEFTHQLINAVNELASWLIISRVYDSLHSRV